MNIKAITTGSSGNLYLINTINNNKYLLECGLDEKTIRKHLFNRNDYINEYKGCFISHIHSDHSESAKWVKKYMPIYSNYEVAEKLNVDYLKPNKAREFEDFSIMPFIVEHGNVENYGYIFKDKLSKVLFITDFAGFEDNISNIEFTEIFIECNWTRELMEEALERTKDTPEYKKYERQFNTHCGLSLLMELLPQLNLSKCKQIHLIHASKEVCDKTLAITTLRNILPNIEINFIINERV